MHPTSAFAAPLSRIRGLDYIFIPEGCLPSSLYTFLRYSAGLARYYHIKGFTEFDRLSSPALLQGRPIS